MSIMIGMFSTESNTFNHNFTKLEDFNIFTGEEVNGIITAKKYFAEYGYDVHPSIASSALPGGVVSEEVFNYHKEILLRSIDETPNLEGIWLHLHGAMQVENIGSGELTLLREIREKVGEEIVIGVVFDIHANHSLEISKYINVMRGYRTIPHSDQENCEKELVKSMVQLIESEEIIHPKGSIVPMMVSGEKATDVQEPVRSVLDYIDYLSEDSRILDASVFLGCPWADVETGNFSVFVTPKSKKHEDFAEKECKKISEILVNRKDEFEFIMEVLEPEEAMKWALEKNDKPIFVTDSGDNTTGGGVGESTEILREVMRIKDNTDKKILVSAILDPSTCEKLLSVKPGTIVDLEIGTGRTIDEKEVKVKGEYIGKGDIMGFLNDPNTVLGDTHLIRVDNVDIVLTNKATSLISPNHFNRALVPIENYDICIVKQGYLFSELLPIASDSVMAATKGATYQFLERLDYKNVVRPIYPLDDVKVSDIKYNFRIER